MEIYLNYYIIKNQTKWIY